MLKNMRFPKTLSGFSLLFFLTSCHNVNNLSSNLSPVAPSIAPPTHPETPVTWELKTVNHPGGYFCSNGEMASGPITQNMINKCLQWGGGSACFNNQWSETLFRQAYGNNICPNGSHLNAITGYCMEGNDSLGPFPQDLITACQQQGGGNSCLSNRWDSQFLLSLIAQAGLINLPSRPPQFVLLAFDGSRSLEAWQKSRHFAKQMAAKNIPLRFTYFISAVYFVNTGDRLLYHPPGRHRVGHSAIGWGGTPEEVKQRLEQLNLAYQEGHEIASHAVGHFDGSRWTEADWTREFNYFDKFIFEAYQINNLEGSLAFDKTAIQGFRAPELGQGPGLYQTLQKKGFRYDTSKVAQSNYWPQKPNGIWNFPLASLTTAKTRKNVLSMDYNFYYAHSQAKPNPANAQFYEEDTFQTYLNYFQANYTGNRAPIHIGHHFSAWNNGTYWNAMFRFAEAVCGQPEVKCITYRELADFMDLLTPEQIATYQKGDFPKLSAKESVNTDLISDDLSGLGVNNPQFAADDFCGTVAVSHPNRR